MSKSDQKFGNLFWQYPPQGEKGPNGAAWVRRSVNRKSLQKSSLRPCCLRSSSPAAPSIQLTATTTLSPTAIPAPPPTRQTSPRSVRYFRTTRGFATGRAGTAGRAGVIPGLARGAVRCCIASGVTCDGDGSDDVGA
jgi:hypothetical protein